VRFAELDCGVGDALSFLSARRMLGSAYHYLFFFSFNAFSLDAG